MLAQLFAILFSVALAYSNRVPCEKFRFYGTSLKEDRTFHRANFIVKVLFALFISGSLLQFIVVGLWLWLAFDISLNLFLGNEWHYLGTTAAIDKLLVNGIRIRKARYSMAYKVSNEKRILALGEYAGLTKLLLVSCAILVINFFL